MRGLGAFVFLVLWAWFLLWLYGCDLATGANDDHVLASVGAVQLRVEDLPVGMAEGLTPKDSLAMLKRYAEAWLRRQLLYQQAASKLAGRITAIEQQVEDYRMGLYIYEYERVYEAMHLDTLVRLGEIDTFYQENREMFVLREPIARCLIVPTVGNGDAVQELKQAYKNCGYEQLQHITTLTMEANIVPLALPDTWLSLQDLKAKVPEEVYHVLKDCRARNYEIPVGEVLYLVNACQWKRAGATAPLEFCQGEVRQLVLNRRKVELLRAMEMEVVQEGVETGRARVWIE